MNNDTKCCSWLRKRPTGQKQSRGKFACCKITSEAGRSNATFAAHGAGHDEHPRLGRKSFFSAQSSGDGLSRATAELQECRNCFPDISNLSVFASSDLG